MGLLCELGLGELDYLGGEAVYLEVGRGQEGLAGFYLGEEEVRRSSCRLCRRRMDATWVNCL